tara:strand:- start:352 stop:1020 length:669 start_codon:yes stop_codon:yes gene_type:complete
MFDFTLFWLVFLPALVLCIKPGPYLLAFIALAAEGRWKAMAVFWCGSTIAALSVYFLLLGGLGLLPDHSGFVFLFIKATASVLFVTMGVKALELSTFNQDNDIKDEKERISKSSVAHAAISGFFLTFSNPYELLFVLTGIPAITGVTSFTLLEISTISAAILSADLLVLIAYCLPVLLIRKKLNNTWLKRIRFGSGLAMIGIGLYIFSTVLLQWDLLKTSLL